MLSFCISEFFVHKNSLTKRWLLLNYEQFLAFCGKISESQFSQAKTNEKYNVSNEHLISHTKGIKSFFIQTQVPQFNAW